MSYPIKSVNIIGSGNVATQLTLKLHQLGIQINQVFSVSIENATTLAKKVGSSPINDLNKLTSADLNLLMIKDDLIEKVATHPNLINSFLAHTSGSISMDALKANRRGVFYPLQTLTKDKTAKWEEIPLLIEASVEKDKSGLLELAERISKVVKEVDSEKRKHIHLAAVFVSNFINHLLVIGEDILNNKDMDFDILKPLIFEQVLKIKDHQPIKIQTGPAKRGDQKIINEHLNLLSDQPEYAAIYDLLSKSIKKRHGDEL